MAETRAKDERLQAIRNQNPHKAARMAMFMWGAEYARQRGGSMDFWDKLSESRKRIARECVAKILEAEDEG